MLDNVTRSQSKQLPFVIVVAPFVKNAAPFVAIAFKLFVVTVMDNQLKTVCIDHTVAGMVILSIALYENLCHLGYQNDNVGYLCPVDNDHLNLLFHDKFIVLDDEHRGRKLLLRFFNWSLIMWAFKISEIFIHVVNLLFMFII
jgi:hypothetical protein